jgi:Cu+-exporting ATPase
VLEAVVARAEFAIGGMSCAACRGHVERALSASPGVARASVDLALESAQVDYDPQRTGVEALVAAVRSAGYSARPLAQPTAPSPVVEAPVRPRDEPEASSASASSEPAAHASAPEGSSWSALLFAGAAAAFAILASLPFMQRTLIEAPELRPRAYALLALTLLVMASAARPIYARAWAGLRHRRTDMNSLIALGTLAAFAHSAGATLAPDWFAAHGLEPELYYEAVLAILALVLLGRALESRARRRASAALRALADLQPAQVRVLRAGALVELPLADLRVGEHVLVRPGERIPVDAEIVEGCSSVDEALLTGESVPRSKGPGERVLGGSLNGSGALELRASAIGSESAAARIAQLMRAAQASRAPLQALADRLCAFFVPLVLALAALTFVAWLVYAEDAALARALSHAIAVLIVACPCALGLAVPTAALVASGRAARAGLLFKGGEALQRAAQLTHIAFDKTGTLTRGQPRLRALVLAPGVGLGELELLEACAALEASSEHPFAAAIRAEARARGARELRAADFSALPGRGARARVDGRELLLGSRALLVEHGIDTQPLESAVREHAQSGHSIVWIALDARLAGALALRDEARAEAREALAALRAQGLALLVLSGDEPRAVAAIAQELGLDEAHGGLLPHEKQERIRALQAGGARVAMVGDGINDGPALASAELGIALGTGTDVALEASELALVRADLRGVPSAIELARRTLRTMRQNLFWAFAYNALCIPIAAGALRASFGLGLSPMLASAAMATSSLCVLANSLRLARWNPAAPRAGETAGQRAAAGAIAATG